MNLLALVLTCLGGFSHGRGAESGCEQVQGASFGAPQEIRALTMLLRASCSPAAAWQANAHGLSVNNPSSIHTRFGPAIARSRARNVHMSEAVIASPDATVAPVVPLPPHVKVKGEILTPYGVMLGVAVFATAIMVQIPVGLAYVWSQLFDKKRRRAVDWIIFFWARFSMTVCGYVPEVIGLENLPKGGANCLYVPNHTSFLDILTLTGFLPRATKYVSKAEILKIPFIGWPMKLAGHIALSRQTRRSQLEAFKDTVQSLKDGNSVITFPEGTRAQDGRLQPFKRGPFKMAIQAGVPIVPVTICDLACWYPKGTLLPINVPKNVRVIIHPQVSTEGVDEATLHSQIFETLNDSLPLYQQAPATAIGSTIS